MSTFVGSLGSFSSIRLKLRFVSFSFFRTFVRFGFFFSSSIFLLFSGFFVPLHIFDIFEARLRSTLPHFVLAPGKERPHPPLLIRRQPTPGPGPRCSPVVPRLLQLGQTEKEGRGCLLHGGCKNTLLVLSLSSSSSSLPSMSLSLTSPLPSLADTGVLSHCEKNM